MSEEYYYGCNSEAEFASIAQSTNAASTLGIPLPSSASGGDRRKTIETCENIFLHAEESSKLRARTPPSNPHRILLHRDKNDTSIRTNGLGMRIVGGQECEDGSLGTNENEKPSRSTIFDLFQDVLSLIFYMADQLMFKATLK